MQIFKKILSIIFRVGISIALLIFLFRRVDIVSLLKIIKNADKGLLFLAFLVCSLPYILSIFRWEMLLKAIKINLSLKRIIISFSGGIFFNLFLPSTIGGDLMRSLDLAAHTKRPKEVIATVFLDRLSGYTGLVIMALIALFFGHKILEDRSVFYAVAVIIGVLVVILLVLFNKSVYSWINKLLHSPDAGKIRELIKNLHQEIHYFREHKKIIICNVFLSTIIQTIPPLAFYVIALAIGIKLNLVYFFIFIPIIGAITLLPISIGGLGLRDAAVVYFFAKAGLSHDPAIAISLLNFFFIVAYAGIGGLIYVLTVQHRRR